MKFSDYFMEFLKDKGFNSPYHLSKESEDQNGKVIISRDYLSRLMNNPIVNPRKKTRKNLAEVFAKRNNSSVEQELEDINNFFEKFNKTTFKMKLDIDLDINCPEDREEIKKIIEKLEKVLKRELIMKDAELGCIILTIESEPEVYDKVRALFNEGTLNHLLGVNVLNVQAEEEQVIDEKLTLESQDLFQSSLHWVQAQIEAKWNIQNFKMAWEGLNIPVLFDNIFFPQEVRLALNTSRRDSGDTMIVTDKEKWRFSKIELQNLNIVLISWLKENNDDFDVCIQLYTSKNQECLPEGVKLRLYSGNECLQIIDSNKSDILIQTNTWNFECDESAKISISYQDFQFEQNVCDLVL